MMLDAHKTISTSTRAIKCANIEQSVVTPTPNITWCQNSYLLFIFNPQSCLTYLTKAPFELALSRTPATPKHENAILACHVAWYAQRPANCELVMHGQLLNHCITYYGIHLLTSIKAFLVNSVCGGQKRNQAQ
jgi:hypothetical protein